MRQCLLLLVLLSGSAFAVERVSVLALFPGKAMLEIDGQRKVLSDGQRHASGLQLLQATPSGARVLIDGQERVLRLGTAVNASYARAQLREIRVVKSNDSFFLDGLINRQPVRMLIDTGASLVALSEQQARGLGIPYVQEGTKTRVGTAAGAVAGYNVRLRSLKVGDRTFENVAAVVVQGDSPAFVLLGMNVLSRFQIEQRQNLMILRSQP